MYIGVNSIYSDDSDTDVVDEYYKQAHFSNRLTAVLNEGTVNIGAVTIDSNIIQGVGIDNSAAFDCSSMTINLYNGTGLVNQSGAGFNAEGVEIYLGIGTDECGIKNFGTASCGNMMLNCAAGGYCIENSGALQGGVITVITIDGNKAYKDLGGTFSYIKWDEY